MTALSALVPQTASAREADPVVPCTLGTRLHFAWVVLWALLVTPPLAAGLLVHNLFRPTAQTFKRWMTLWARTLLAGAGIRLEVETRVPLPADRPVVLVANHQNALDIVTCSAGIPHPYGYAAKAELRRTPIVGAVLRRSACVFVDKSSPRRAAQSVREAAALIAAGNSVLVYPEGERTYRADLLPFQRGAFLLAVEAGVPIVPVAQIGNRRVFDERIAASQPGRVRLVTGTPIPTTGCTREDVPALMEAARAAIARELGLPEAEGVPHPPDQAVSSARA